MNGWTEGSAQHPHADPTKKCGNWEVARFYHRRRMGSPSGLTRAENFPPVSRLCGSSMIEAVQGRGGRSAVGYLGLDSSTLQKKLTHILERTLAFREENFRSELFTTPRPSRSKRRNACNSYSTQRSTSRAAQIRSPRSPITDDGRRSSISMRRLEKKSRSQMK